MKKKYPFPKTMVQEILRYFMIEDEGYGDITSEILIPKDKMVRALIFTREECILSGTELINELYIPEGCKVLLKAQDGDLLKKNQEIAIISGPMRGILLRERLILNLLARMCGIATKTWHLVSLIPKGSKVVIAATRKTTPGLRILEKYAVACGGGDPHRLRLDDMVLLKDNHRVLYQSITEALDALKKNLSFTKKIEVEVEDFDTLLEAAKAGADIIMLDNMTVQDVQKAILLLEENKLREKVLVEVSGGVNEKNVAEYAKAQPDIISIGAITHSFKSIDLSLDIIK